MPQLLLSKVAFGCRDLDMLRARIAARSEGGEFRVPTRMRPKRAAELIGGNLYWIVKHRMIGCNRILAFEDREDGRINILCSDKLEAITPMPRRAHQGWRYLEMDAAEAADESGVGELPPQLYGRLSALALV